MMPAARDKQKETIWPDFHRSINIDFQGAKITSDTGFQLVVAGSSLLTGPLAGICTVIILAEGE